jgi:hypothetical protein
MATKENIFIQAKVFTGDSGFHGKHRNTISDHIQAKIKVFPRIRTSPSGYFVALPESKEPAAMTN